MPSAGTISFKLVGQTAQFNRSMQQAKSSLANMEAKLEKVGASAAVAFAGMGLAIRKVAMTFATFEAGIVRAGAISGATADELKLLEKRALDLAASTKFTGSEVTQAYKFMAMAGQDTNTIMASIEPTLQLAAAGAVGLGEAADVVTSIMAGFGKEASEMVKVNDVLASAITGSKVNVSTLGEAFKLAGPQAVAAGIGFESVAAALSVLGNRGIDASLAGTALRRAMVNLQAPTSAAEEVISRLGLNFKKADGSLKDFTGIIQELERVSANTGDKVALFGIRGLTAMQALQQGGSRELQRFMDRFKEAGGLAESLADKEMATFSGAMNILNANIERAMITLGKGMEPALRTVADAVGFASKLFSALPPTLVEIGGTLTVVTAGMLALAATAAGIMKIRAALLATSVAAVKLIAPLLLIPTLLGQAAQIGELLANPRAFVANLRKRQDVSADAGVGEIAGAVMKDAFQKGIAPLKDAMAFVSKEILGDSKDGFDNLNKTTKTASEEIENLGTQSKKAAEVAAMDFGGAGQMPVDFQSLGDIVNEGVDELNAIDFSGVTGGLITDADLLGDAVKESATSFQDVVSNVQSVIGQSAPKLSALAGDIAQGASKGGVWGAIIGAVLNLLKQTEGFSTIMKQGEEGVGMLVQALDDILKPVFDLVINVNKIANPLLKLATTFLGAAMKFDLVLAATGKVAEIAGKVAEGFEAIGKAFINLWNDLINKLANLVGKVSGKLARFIRRALIDTGEAQQDATDALRRLAEQRKREQAAARGATAEAEKAAEEIEQEAADFGVAKGFKRALRAWQSIIPDQGGGLPALPSVPAGADMGGGAVPIEGIVSTGDLVSALSGAGVGGGNINIENLVVRADDPQEMQEEIEFEAETSQPSNTPSAAPGIKTSFNQDMRRRGFR